jgi:uncharacterized protein
MDCPIDSTQLVMSERQGVEIDYCPKCRGVWLDRGELDKILDRVTRLESPPEPRDEDRRREPRYEEGRGSTHHGDPAHRKKKRKSFLEDVFEFGG